MSYKGVSIMRRFVCLILILITFISHLGIAYAQGPEGPVRNEKEEYERFKKENVGTELVYSTYVNFLNNRKIIKINFRFSNLKYKDGSARLVVRADVDGKSYNITDIVPGLKNLKCKEKSYGWGVEIKLESDVLEQLRNIDNDINIAVEATAEIQESAIVKDRSYGGYSLNYNCSPSISSDWRDIFLGDSNDITVVWDDDNDRDGLRPSDPIYLELSREGGGNSLYKLIKAPQRPNSEQELRFTNRPSGFKEGKLDGKDVANYEKIPFKNLDGSHTLIYKHKPATVEIPVSIEWDDNNDELGNRPSSVTLDIRPLGASSSASVSAVDMGQSGSAQDVDTVEAADSWSKTFEKYKNDKGREIEYVLNAPDVDRYEKELTKTGNAYKIKYISTAIKAKPISPSAKRSVIAKKVWLGGTKDEHKEAVLTLYRHIDGGEKEIVNQKADIKKVDAVNTSTTSEVRSEYIYTWKDLDTTDTNGKGYIYSVDEENVPQKYEKKVDDATLTITNKRKPDPKPLVKPEPRVKEDKMKDYAYKEAKPRQETRELDLYRFYVLGDGDGKFRPHSGIKRSEIAQIFANILDYDKEAIPLIYKAYTDVKEDAWYFEAVQKTSAKGIFAGYDDGEFKPDKEITQAELISVIKRYQELADEKENIMNIEEAHWAKNEINAAAKKNWLEIYQKHITDFDPDRVITREEVVSILNRAFERPLDKKYIDEMKDTLKGYLDVDSSMWSYYDIASASNTYLVDASDKKSKDKWVNHAVQDEIAMSIDKIKWHKALRNDARIKEVLREVKFKR